MENTNIKSAVSEQHVTDTIKNLKALIDSVDEITKKMYSQLVEIVKSKGGFMLTYNTGFDKMFAYINESEWGCEPEYTEKIVMAIKVEDDSLYVLLGDRDSNEPLINEEGFTQDEINEILDGIRYDEIDYDWLEVDADNYILTTPTLYWMCFAMDEYLNN